jgi:signal transduction histidine kinase
VASVEAIGLKGLSGALARRGRQRRCSQPAPAAPRIEEIRLQTERPVDLRELIESAVATLHAIARRKRIDVAIRVEGDGPVHLDSKLVRRALEDLLGNALKYTPPGEDVSVSARCHPDGVVLEVADRGPGIPAGTREAMLSTPSNGNGSTPVLGLGLYLVEQVARGHGGKLEILDRDGGGAVIRLQLHCPARGADGASS